MIDLTYLYTFYKSRKRWYTIQFFKHNLLDYSGLDGCLQIIFARGMRKYLIVACINDKLLKIWIGNKRFEYLLRHSTIMAPAELAVCLLQSPRLGGESRRGKPVLNIQKAALISNRLSA